MKKLLYSLFLVLAFVTQLKAQWVQSGNTVQTTNDFINWRISTGKIAFPFLYLYSKTQVDSIVTHTNPSPNIVQFIAGASNPITLTWSTYISLYGNSPSLIIQELTSTGIYRTRTDVQPVFTYSGTILTSVQFYIAPVPNGRIIIKL